MSFRFYPLPIVFPDNAHVQLPGTDHNSGDNPEPIGLSEAEFRGWGQGGIDWIKVDPHGADPAIGGGRLSEPGTPCGQILSGADGESRPGLVPESW